METFNLEREKEGKQKDRNVHAYHHYQDYCLLQGRQIWGIDLPLDSAGHIPAVGGNSFPLVVLFLVTRITYFL